MKEMELFSKLNAAANAVKTYFHDEFTFNGQVSMDAGLSEMLRGVPNSAKIWVDDLWNSARDLERVLPLEQRESEGICDRLHIEIATRKRFVLGVKNTMGAKESVVSWPVVASMASTVADWSRCRRESKFLDTPWDRARRTRRVVETEGRGRAIDPGVNLAFDIISSTGASVVASSEGHPDGAYVSWMGGPDDLKRIFGQRGWRSVVDIVDGDGRHRGLSSPFRVDMVKTVARMPKHGDVDKRDDDWRETCRALQDRFEFEHAALPAP